MMNSWKYVLVAGATATLSGCFFGDPNAYSATPIELADAFRGKSSAYKSGRNTHTMRVVSGSDKGVYVSLSADGSSSGRKCRIRFEPVDSGTTRISPDCGKASSPSMEPLNEYTELKVMEHAKHILTGEPVNVAYLDNARMASAMKAIPKVQAEAREMMKEVGNESKYIQNAQKSADGWGTE